VRNNVHAEKVMCCKVPRLPLAPNAGADGEKIKMVRAPTQQSAKNLPTLYVHPLFDLEPISKIGKWFEVKEGVGS
jgi:hypothetical protein